MRSKTIKVVSIVMRYKVKERPTVWKNCPNGMFMLVKGLKTNSKEVEGGRCMRGSD